MNSLPLVLESLKHEINVGTLSELEAEGEPLSYINLPPKRLAQDIAKLTAAIINSLKDDTFAPLKVHVSWISKVRLEQGFRLPEIMAFLEHYEKAVKDAMSLYLKNELPILNIFRRDFDSLLDRVRVHLTEYFFILYEDTVFRQFEQLRTINEITTRMTSSMNINDVLDFIVSSAMRLFKADCGSILLTGQANEWKTPIATAWYQPDSPVFISETVLDTVTQKVIEIKSGEALSERLINVLQNEQLCSVKAIRLCFQDFLIGILAIGFRSACKSTPIEQTLFATFANHASIAVYNAQLYGDADSKLKQQVHAVTVLLEQKRAIMQCMREGVVAINTDGYINIVNSEAERLLNIPTDLIGKYILDVLPNSRLPIVVKTRQAEYDQEQEVGDKVIITNRVPIIVDGEVIGALATFRDKEDVKVLAEEIIGLQSLLDSMRAQSHEFANKLHAISGLIQMKQYDKVVELITLMYKSQQEFVSFIVKRIKDQATAGLIIGKISQSTEQGISLRLNSRSKLESLPPVFGSLAMVTVLGNLISNAIDAVQGLPSERKVINVYIYQGKKYLTIKVSDFGPGIPEVYKNKIYQRGFSTKRGSRGVGLYLVKKEVAISGGKITVQSQESQGSIFSVKIPIRGI
ncbi:Adaptive-response sensory-kinase SasA [Sporomusa rhizae]|uniref:ATP-binding protein n=1 Tax=Sporomusa rhizae TaxID=357999 RepID=UPI00352AA7E0